MTNDTTLKNEMSQQNPMVQEGAKVMVQPFILHCFGAKLFVSFVRGI